MTYKFLSHSALAALVTDLVAANVRVIAPVRAKDDANALDYLPIQCLEDAALGVALPRHSLKEFFLPATEVLLRYRQTHEGVEIQEVSTEFPAQVILAASPCDAAGAAVLDKVMGWDYRDELWFGRRESTTIVSLLCGLMDRNCFCTAVGLGPDSSKGSDVLLLPVEGGYLAEVVTEKGEALLSAVPEASEEVRSQTDFLRAEARGKVENNLAAIPTELPAWLAANFDNPVWKTMALRCHGCGACASVCPSCHCFDIVDEHESSEQGVRRRNWDSCQTSKFTIHASGHNPRGTQIERFRQRIMHKFSIYPTRFGEILCAGCGRCTRVCPGGQDLPEFLGTLSAMAKSECEGSGQ